MRDELYEFSHEVQDQPNDARRYRWRPAFIGVTIVVSAVAAVVIVMRLSDVRAAARESAAL